MGAHGRGFQTGNATPQEGLRILGNRRLGLVFSIISEDLIEKFGQVPENGKKPLDELVHRIAADQGRDEELVGQVLGDFSKLGRIQADQTPEGTTWR